MKQHFNIDRIVAWFHRLGLSPPKRRLWMPEMVDCPGVLNGAAKQYTNTGGVITWEEAVAIGLRGS